MRESDYFGGCLYVGAITSTFTIPDGGGTNRVLRVEPSGNNRKVKMPDATTLPKGWWCIITNESDTWGILVQDADTNYIRDPITDDYVNVGECCLVRLIDNSTAAGSWIQDIRDTGAVYDPDPDYIGHAYWTSESDGLEHIWTYNQQSSTWTEKASRPAAVGFDDGALTSQGAVLNLIGGDSATDDTNWEWSPSTNLWTAQESIPTTNGNWDDSGAEEMSDGKVLLGFAFNIADDWDIYKWNPAVDPGGYSARGTISNSDPPDSANECPLISDKWYVEDSYWNEFFVFDDGTQVTSQLSVREFSTKYSPGVSESNKPWLLGGKYNTSSDYTDDVSQYDPSTDLWTHVTDIPDYYDDGNFTPYGSPAWSIDGKIYVTVGLNDVGDTQSVLQVYDISADTWTAIGTVDAEDTGDYRHKQGSIGASA